MITKHPFKAAACAAAFCLLLLTACGGSEQPVHGDQGGHEDADKAMPKVELNDGAKWATNAYTPEGIARMTQIAGSFVGEDDADAFAALADSLEAEFLLIFQNCTMEGEAHNQLHNYLLPLSEHIEALRTGSIPELHQTHTAIKGHLALYHTYFE